MAIPSAPEPALDDHRPFIALRVATTYDATTRRVDLRLSGSTGTVVEGGVERVFAADQLWPTVRELLPPLDILRADPAGSPRHESRTPGPGWVDSCTANVVIATMVGHGDDLDPVAVRTWLTSQDAADGRLTDSELWAVRPRADGSNDVHTMPAGSVADLLIWDVTAAMESLVRLLVSAQAAS